MRDIFSFTFRGRQYHYTRVPQGFLLSLGLLNHALHGLLQDLQFPPDAVVVQCVDDILIAATSAEDSLGATRLVLMRLMEQWFKVSKEKLQCTRREVTLLGRVVSG